MPSHSLGGVWSLSVSLLRQCPRCPHHHHQGRNRCHFAHHCPPALPHSLAGSRCSGVRFLKEQRDGRPRAMDETLLRVGVLDCETESNCCPSCCAMWLSHGTEPISGDSPGMQGHTESHLPSFESGGELACLWLHREGKLCGHPKKQVTNSPDPHMSDQEPGSLSLKRLGILGPGPGTWTHIDGLGRGVPRQVLLSPSSDGPSQLLLDRAQFSSPGRAEGVRSHRESQTRIQVPALPC